MESVSEFVKAIPPVTRFLFLGTLALTLAGNYGLVNPYYLVLLPEAVTRFHLWRFVTAFLFFGGLNFNFLMHLYFLYTYSKMLETEHFSGRPADYVFFITFCMIIFSIVGFVMGLVLLGPMLNIAILYLWSQIFSNTIVSFWFGLRFKAVFLPWVLVGLDVLTGQSPLRTLVGIAVGHIYYYLKSIHPVNTGQDLLQTPQFFFQLFPSRTVMAGVGGWQQERAPGNGATGGATRGRGYNWGAGRRLDD